MARIITFLIWSVVGYGVGWLCGLVVGSTVWYFRAKRAYGANLVLAALDDATDWDFEDVEER
jgi:hypothetical protein